MDDTRTAMAVIRNDIPFNILVNPTIKKFPNIDPNNIYDVGYIKEIFTRRCIETLTKHGLRSICGQYLGQSILDAHKKASTVKFINQKNSSLASEQIEGVNDGKKAKDRVEKKTRQPKIQRVSTFDGFSLVSKWFP